jgi:SNF2 family DNA or RNA helicase
MVICDEAHHICNHHTLGYAAVRALKADAKWLFSGTLISNNLNEIRSALALVGVSEEVLQSAALEEKQALATFARPFWIRRVLEIPEPIPCHRVKWTSRPEMLLWRRMVTVFNDAVQKARHHLKQRINLLAMLPPDDDEEDDMEEEDALPLYPNAQELPLDLGVEGGQTELRWLQHLRRFCLSPYLCQNLFSHNPGSAAVAGIECIPMPADVHFFPWSLEQVFPRQEKISKKKKRDDSDAMDVASVEDEDDHLKELMRCMVLEALGVEVTTPDHPLRTRVIPPVSPKEGWVCRTLLSEFTDVCGEKVVIFSNFRKPLERLAFLLDLRLRLGIPGARAFAHVHGGISQQQREQERLRFMNDPGCGVLLAIIDIYKESIDLTVANHVVLYDPWWTPRDEFQAIHRILGVKQTRKTYRYRLIQDGTIDQIVADVADLKIALDLEILPPTRVEEERTNTKKVWNLMGGM